MDEKMTGGELRAARLLLGYKRQLDLAEEIGYSRVHISRLEKGHDDIPTLLAAYMRVKLSYKTLKKRHSSCLSELASAIRQVEKLETTE
ncbi:MAG: hypothetical protein DSY80_00525 [Desulfocapsa sp.]|nr:MAG: hypothetical protein DSY80_00525 [Desulfocapsa sp.]